MCLVQNLHVRTVGCLVVVLTLFAIQLLVCASAVINTAVRVGVKLQYTICPQTCRDTFYCVPTSMQDFVSLKGLEWLNDEVLCLTGWVACPPRVAANSRLRMFGHFPAIIPSGLETPITVSIQVINVYFELLRVRCERSPDWSPKVCHRLKFPPICCPC